MGGATLVDQIHARAGTRYRRTSWVVVGQDNGVQTAFPAKVAEGLPDASADDLADIEISPAGLGLRWPKLDADVYVPALLQSVLAPSDGWPPNSALRAGRPAQTST